MCDDELNKIIEEQRKRIAEVDLYLRDARLRDSARDELYKILYKKKINMECTMNVCKDSSIQLLFDEVQLLKEQNNRSSQKQYWYWITFNPKEEITLAQMLKFTDKLLSKKWIQEAFYSYEQRGENMAELGKGLHMHILIKRNNFKTTHAKREVYNTFKNLTGISEKVFADKCFKSIPYSWGQDKIDYLKGNKWDNEKEAKINMDVEFRKKNNLDIYYTYDASEKKESCKNKKE